MDTIRFYLPPPQLSCLIGNLFRLLDAPCGAGQLEPDGITLYGWTISEERGELHIFPDHCTFTGNLEDYRVARFTACPERGCNGRIQAGE